MGERDLDMPPGYYTPSVTKTFPLFNVQTQINEYTTNTFNTLRPQLYVLEYNTAF